MNSDVFGMFQSLVEGRTVPWELLVKDVPKDKHQDLDYIIGMLDWDANVNPNFGHDNKRVPATGVSVRRERSRTVTASSGCATAQSWYSAKELTVLPGRTVTIKDAAAYGLIVVQGDGTFGTHRISAPTMIRFGEMTQDELFVSAETAKAGVAHRECERQRSAGDSQALRAW